MPTSKSAKFFAARTPARGEIPGFPPAFWAGEGNALYLGDVRACLRRMPARSVHCCVTSPPYFGLRRYLEEGHPDGQYEIGAEAVPDCLCWATGKACGKCFVCHLVEVFSEVRRVLRDDGTCWLNLGDTYTGGGRGGDANSPGMGQRQYDKGDRWSPTNNHEIPKTEYIPSFKGFSSGNLVGTPWRVALALQADGWVLRQDIIWYSPNKLPEGMTNRCSKSHEYIFLLTKGNDYYYDSVAIEEPAKPSHRDDEIRDRTVNKRDVWVVATHGYPGAHFATFSPRLISPCILAGTSEYGCCAACGDPYERIVSRIGGQPSSPSDDRDRSIPSNRNGITGSLDGVFAARRGIGWRKVCGCPTDEVIPAVVLDPFIGSGTTVATSIELGRCGVGIDLSEQYLREHAVPRIEAALRGERIPRKSSVVVRESAPPPPQVLR